MENIHILNCFTCNARVPSHWHCGTTALLVETRQGLALVDTGLGTEDYIQGSGILNVFRIITRVPLDPREAVVLQIARLGYKPEDVRHVILTHMHFDHCGGLPDFPHAKVHVHRRELAAFTGRPHLLSELAYVHRHIAHKPDWQLYEETGEKWYDFDAIRLPFNPGMWLVPLHGHARGHCGVAVQVGDGWLLDAGDAAALFNQEAPDWLIKFALGPHQARLGAFAADHPEVRVVTGHNWLDWYEENKRG